MKNHTRLFFPLMLILTFLVTGCGSAQTVSPTDTEEPATATPIAIATQTATPDLCAPENVQAEVDKVHRHMREFDDASILASSTPLDQLGPAIADLQRIRRAAEDEKIPSCLANLKKYEVDHMNAVIETLIAFTRGSEKTVIDQGIAIARQLHDQYLLEYARLLGLTPLPATAAPLPTQTPTP